MTQPDPHITNAQEAGAAWQKYYEALQVLGLRVEKGSRKHFLAGWDARSQVGSPLSQVVIPEKIFDLVRQGRRITAFKTLRGENPRLSNRQAEGLINFLSPILRSNPGIPDEDDA